MLPQTRQLKKLWEIATFSQWIQVPIQQQYIEKKSWSFPFLRIIDFTQWDQEERFVLVEDAEKYLVDENDIAMVRYWNPWLAFIWYKWILANNLFRIRVSKDTDFKFLYHFFLTPQFKNIIAKECYWAAMKAVNFWTIKNIQIPLPPLSTQKLIVKHLDQISTHISTLKQSYKTKKNQLLELKASVLHEAFQGKLVQ